MRKRAKVAIIGGGIAGSTVALYLSELGVDITLFEKKASLVDGPPICHLHAGGNLYREISNEQCVRLLDESIELVRYYPQCIDYRPTVICIPQEDKGRVEDLSPRLKLLKEEYAKLVKEDKQNRVLADAQEYYKLYDKETILKLKNMDSVKNPKSLDEWMIPVAKNVALEKIKFPLIIVQEYGINIFRLASDVTLRLERQKDATLKLQSKVIDLKKEGDSFTLRYKHSQKRYEQNFDFIINAAGFESGKLDDMLEIKRDRFVEFKAAYVTKWEENSHQWPEVIFHGERGTPKGMAQFTPYPGGFFQLHGMTKEITLFEDGLVKNDPKSSQPKLASKFIQKIEKSWNESIDKKRSQAALSYLSSFIPSFKSAKRASKPLFGAQQIPGDDENLRAAEVTFVDERYARCEIVKASSVLKMSREIAKQLEKLGYLEKDKEYQATTQVDEDELQELAIEIVESREYPKCMAYRNIAL